MQQPNETIFSKIIRREIPAKIVYETDTVLAFHDVNPQAPTHVLIIPKRRLRNLTEVQAGDATILGELLLASQAVATSLGVAQTGYRIVINNGAHAGQPVDHLHLHLLAGRALGWPPG